VLLVVAVVAVSFEDDRFESRRFDCADLPFSLKEGLLTEKKLRMEAEYAFDV
jgi:hypothetical protein